MRLPQENAKNVKAQTFQRSAVDFPPQYGWIYRVIHRPHEGRLAEVLACIPLVAVNRCPAAADPKISRIKG